MIPTDAGDARASKLIRSAARARVVLVLLALAIPGCLHGLVERHAGRLESLADHGQLTTATVTGASGDRSIGYAYEVEGRRYTWSVAPSAVPPRASSFPILYLPEEPSFSRPGNDRAVAIVAAKSNRAFAWKLEASVFYFFAALAVFNEFQLRSLRRGDMPKANDPRGYRTRLLLIGLLFSPLFALVVGGHAVDAAAQGQSLAPVVLGALLTLAVLFGTWFYLSRDGVSGVAARSARLFKWLIPLALGLAALRVLAWFLS